jgi:gamma-glutamyltranspeptidase / glutathione hydrolase
MTRRGVQIMPIQLTTLPSLILLFPAVVRTVMALALLLTGLEPGARAAPALAAQPAWQHAAVAADHPLASEAGIEMLKQGGNVVDAAVAVGFALSVLRPASSGMGGGGFMVIWDAKLQRSIALDYRERAPLTARREIYSEGANDSSRRGALAVAVPGHVLGLCHALKNYGTLPLSTILRPAIRFAKEGVRLDEHERSTRTNSIQQCRKHQKEFVGFWNEYHYRHRLSYQHWSCWRGTASTRSIEGRSPSTLSGISKAAAGSSRWMTSGK